MQQTIVHCDVVNTVILKDVNNSNNNNYNRYNNNHNNSYNNYNGQIIIHIL